MKIKGVKKAVSMLKRVQSNRSFGRVFINLKTGELNAWELVSSSDRPQLGAEWRQIITYNPSYCNSPCPTMAEIREAAKDVCMYEGISL